MTDQPADDDAQLVGAEMDNCTIVTEFLGVTFDPCGAPATHSSTGRCERGHTRVRRLCTGHVKAFAAMPAAVVCAQCAEEGHDTQARVVTTPDAERVG